MGEELISIIDLADELGRNKQHMFKVLNRLGIERQLLKSSKSRGQRIAYISSDDRQRVIEYFHTVSSDEEQAVTDSNTGGVFYLIQLEPEHDPGRFKLGFATNIEERIRSHKTAAPFAELLKTWPCKLLWEKTAIDCAAQGCERLHTEIFRAESIEAVQSRCDQFFTLMPDIDAD